MCWCTNEAFNQASPTKEFWENCPQKRVGIFTVKMRAGHIYGNYYTVSLSVKFPLFLTGSLMQTLLSSMAVDLIMCWVENLTNPQWVLLLRGFCEISGWESQSKEWWPSKIGLELDCQTICAWRVETLIHSNTSNSFLHPFKIMGWSCQRVGWEYLSAIIRGGAHFCQRWVKNECRSMCRGGAKASFFRCRQSPSDVSAEVWFHRPANRPAQNQSTTELQASTNYWDTMFESASEKSSTALVCPESGCLARYDLAKLALATREMPKREGGRAFTVPYCESEFQTVVENILSNFFENCTQIITWQDDGHLMARPWW